MKNLSFAHHCNADLIDEQYQTWLNDPDALTPEWRAFLEGFELANSPGATSNDSSGPGSPKAGLVALAIYAYRTLGHQQAHINPLTTTAETIGDLTLESLGLDSEDLSEYFPTCDFGAKDTAQLKDILNELKATYCNSVGFEFMHIQDLKKRSWLQDRIESNFFTQDLSKEKLSAALTKIIEAETFESVLHRRFVGQKRFSIEGGESAIALMHAVSELSPELSIKEIILGMAHRGRLNVLANTLHKPLLEIVREFSEKNIPEVIHGDWDVKYHIGYKHSHTTATGQTIQLQLASNPSHLESVNGVIQGQARARQEQLKDLDRKQVLPFLIHGDASFMGQGVVAETLNYSQLEGYTTGGTFHLIINNQIGFTTGPQDDRSSRYCSDLAKFIEAPIFHVNGDDPLNVIRSAELALCYRQEFGEDVVIDLCCYRKHGHNESDEPKFTQPILYNTIAKHPQVSSKFAQDLEKAGHSWASDVAKKASDTYTKLIDDAIAQAKALEEKVKIPTTLPDKFQSYGKNGFQDAFNFKPVKTAATKKQLEHILKTVTSYPEGFNINSKIKRQLGAKVKAFESDAGIDWSLGEAFTFGSLLDEGTSLRVSGQDSIRGTFSHRHAAFFDTKTEEQYTPLKHLSKKQGRFTIFNSCLSEFAVLGYEYGYALEHPTKLVIWEGQFGDFANGAQVIIDQYIASAESKWHDTSSLVLLLPHGYQGQGPEHSSAKLERFLQLCAEDNMQVANPTTPAQFFHLLRRQMKRSFKKPLIVMSPKNLLRHKECVSSIKEFTEGYFEEILPDPKVTKAERIILCSGKIYYELLEYQKEHKQDKSAIVRIEQLYPFHIELLDKVLKKHKDAKNLIWCQEEPKNMGAWSFMGATLMEQGMTVKYAGRSAAASPSTGLPFMHKLEQAKLIKDAFTL